MRKNMLLIILLVILLPVITFSQVTTTEELLKNIDNDRRQELDRLSKKFGGLKSLQQRNSVTTKVPNLLIKQVVKDVFANNSSDANRYKDRKYIAKLSKTFPKANLFDLNNDGKPEYIVWMPDEWNGDRHSDLGIYEQTKNGYKTLFYGGITGFFREEGFFIAETSTNGYRNIVIDFWFVGYKFNGKQYEAIENESSSNEQ